jgi:hypothetical protein
MYSMLSVMARFLKGAPTVVLVPVAVVGTAALALFLLGVVPGYVQGPSEGISEYDSMEEAESRLGFDIVVPSYFPDYLAWPPAEVRGQLQPIPMAQTLFLSSDDRAEVLLISQILSSGEDLPIAWPWVESIQWELPATIGDHEGTMIVGRNEYGRELNGVHWRAEDFHFVLVTVYRVQELMTLARSMHPKLTMQSAND